jgi:hypothetical protein
MSKMVKVRLRKDAVVSYLQDELSISSNDRNGLTLTFTGTDIPYFHEEKNCLVFRRGDKLLYLPLWNVNAVSEYD